MVGRGAKGREWGEKVFPVMRDKTGMEQDNIMRGGDEDPILRPRPITIPITHAYNLLYIYLFVYY